MSQSEDRGHLGVRGAIVGSDSGSGEPTAGTPALEVRSVVKRFGEVPALDGVSLAIPPGQSVALVGESGSGKTTFLRLFNVTVTPDEGTVTVGGKDVSRLDPIAHRRTIGYVQQHGGLLPHWTVARNVSLMPRLQGRRDTSERVAESLAEVGLREESFGDRWPRELSGGQRQRVAMARALAGLPRIMLLDEPFGALDAITRAELQEALRELIRRHALTSVLVTHDLNEAVRVADSIVVLKDGRIQQVAAPRELVEAPATEYVRVLVRRAGVTLPQ